MGHTVVARLVGDPLPGRAAGARAGDRARAVHAGRGRGRRCSPAGSRGPVLWGAGKARAVARVRRRARRRPRAQLRLLQRRRGRPVPGDGRQPARAQPASGPRRASRASASWPVARFAPPRAGRGCGTIARTGAALAGWGAAAGLGARRRPAERQPPRRRSNLGGGAGRASSACAGRGRRRRHGAENLWSQRPAVFIFNHQSQLDMLVVGEAAAQRLHRRGEEGGRPRSRASRSSAALADVAFVDRGNPAQAREALAPAVDKLRDGISIVMAPGGHALADAAPAARSRRARSTSRCRPACRSCRSCSATRASSMWRGSAICARARCRSPCCRRSRPTTGRCETLDERVAEVRGAVRAHAGRLAGRGPRPPARPPEPRGARPRGVGRSRPRRAYRASTAGPRPLAVRAVRAEGEHLVQALAHAVHEQLVLGDRGRVDVDADAARAGVESSATITAQPGSGPKGRCGRCARPRCNRVGRARGRWRPAGRCSGTGRRTSARRAAPERG